MSALPMNKTTKPGYGRARLWLGISVVGTIVTLATLVLFWGVSPEVESLIDSSITAKVISLFLFVLIYVLIQLPFDFLGGYWVPKKFGRSHPNITQFSKALLRGIVTHSILLFCSSLLIMTAGMYGRIAGTVLAGIIMSLLMLQFRVQIASWMSQMRMIHSPSANPPKKGQLNSVIIESSDEGFTGGIVGVLRPRFQLFPKRWVNNLSPEGLELAESRRRFAVESGSWLRGRLVAFLFTGTGLLGRAVHCNCGRPSLWVFLPTD